MIDNTITFEKLITFTKPKMIDFIKEHYESDFIIESVRVDYIKPFEKFSEIEQIEVLEADSCGWDKRISVALYSEKGWIAPKAFVFYCLKERKDVKDTEAVEQ